MRKQTTLTNFDSGVDVSEARATGAHLAWGLCLLLAVGFAGQAAAQTWTPTGDMNEPRIAHTATLLEDGRVLVAGGYKFDLFVGGGREDLDTAELYNPVFDNWIQTGSMAHARDGARTVRLQDGRVLVTGGRGASDPGNTAEIYDPGTGSWTAAANMGVARADHTATLLPNGRVLVVGGYISGYLNAVELYDPGANTWTNTGSMQDGRRFHTATLMANGKVLVAGGEGVGYCAPAGNCNVPGAEIYDPSSGTWSAAGTLNQARAAHMASLLPDDHNIVLVAGGFQNADDRDQLRGTAELYDPVSNTWTLTGALNEPRVGPFNGVRMADGNVLITGGFVEIPLPDGVVIDRFDTVEIYDASLGTWSPTSLLNEGRHAHTVTLLSDDRVLVAAGDSDAGGSDTAEVYPFPIENPPLEVAIDVKPGHDPNCFNDDGHGVIQVAVLGNEAVDVIDIDIPTLALDGQAVALKGNTKVKCNFGEVNGDFFEDLTCHFEDADGTYEPGEGTATLTGALIDATPIFGTDSICIIK